MSAKPTKEFAQQEVLRVLSDFSPMSHKQVAEALGLRPKTAYMRLSLMWDQKLIHIDHYKRNKGRGAPTPFYAIGCCVDAEPLKPIPALVLQRNYRATVHGTSVRKSHEAISNAKQLKRRREDPAYAEEYRRYQREWSRKKHGTGPRELRSPRLLDEIAMQFGITRRFAGRKNERKAA